MSLSEQCKKAQTEASRLEMELQEERKRRSRLKSILQEAADSLREALMVVNESKQEPITHLCLQKRKGNIKQVWPLFP